MLDFFFFLKTMFLTFIIVLLLQIEIGKKTVETHVHDWMVGSIAAGFLGHAAEGGAHFLKDATFKLTQKMKDHIGLKHKKESAETKASHFHWEWSKAKDSQIDNAPETHSALSQETQEVDAD